MSSRFRLTLLAAGTALALAAPSAAQQAVKRDSIKPINDIAGAASFKAYCTVCHGTSGRGDGPAASALKTPPADLTQISKRHGGTYPALTVRMTITGDSAMPAHGTAEMPMWGPVFRSVEGDSATALRVKNLVDYLETLQQK
jgi:mono/diheme cytochrome c family protein